MGLTLDQVLEALPEALRGLQADLLQHAKEYYPHGEIIRFRVMKPLSATLGMLDPLAVVCLARTGRWTGILDGMVGGYLLGLEDEDTLRLQEAADNSLEHLRKKRAEEVVITLRETLEAVVEGVYGVQKEAKIPSR